MPSSLYAVLLRYGQTSGQRMPGRALLARRLREGSKDTVDRALEEHVAEKQTRPAGRYSAISSARSSPS